MREMSSTMQAFPVPILARNAAVFPIPFYIESN